MMRRKKLILAAVVGLGVAVVAWWWVGRPPMEADGPRQAPSNAVSAAFVRVQRHDLGGTLTIAGAFKPFQDVDVHAKVAGYIRVIYVDVGDHVKEGQTLAILEVPELAAQLTGADAAVRAAQEQIRRADGDLQRAQSNHAAVHSAYVRLKQAADSRVGLVAQQEVDDSQAKDLEAEGQVASAEAALSAAKQQFEVSQATQKQYTALSDYTRITAPFAGVVTVRYADTGALIAAGTASSTQSTPVVRIAQISVLRLVLPIPESTAGQIRLGDPIKVNVQALNQDYIGKVSRFADALDPQTRTMETEIDFQNRDGKLLPGMYVEAILGMMGGKNVLAVPLEAVEVNGTEGTVLVINSQNVLEECKIRLGLQGNTEIQVLSGLADGERVVVGSRNEFRAGMKVDPKEIQIGQPGSAGAR
jgi:RND family efflux transporter MFP subunit